MHRHTLKRSTITFSSEFCFACFSSCGNSHYSAIPNSLKRIPQGVNLLLMRPLDGPQDIELELTMNVYTGNRVPSGSSVAKIFLLVSEYPF